MFTTWTLFYSGGRGKWGFRTERGNDQRILFGTFEQVLYAIHCHALDLRVTYINH